MCWNIEQNQCVRWGKKNTTIGKYFHLLGFEALWREKMDKKLLKMTDYFLRLSRYVLHPMWNLKKNVELYFVAVQHPLCWYILSWVIQPLQFILHNSMVYRRYSPLGKKPCTEICIILWVFNGKIHLSIKWTIARRMALIFFSADIQQHFNNLKAVWITSVIWKHFNFATWTGIIIGLHLTSYVNHFRERISIYIMRCGQ